MNMDTFRNHSSKRKWLVDIDGDPRGETWTDSKILRKKKNQEDLAIAWMGLGKEKGIGAKDNSVALNPDLY